MRLTAWEHPPLRVSSGHRRAKAEGGRHRVARHDAAHLGAREPFFTHKSTSVDAPALNCHSSRHAPTPPQHRQELRCSETHAMSARAKGARAERTVRRRVRRRGQTRGQASCPAHAPARLSRSTRRSRHALHMKVCVLAWKARHARAARRNILRHINEKEQRRMREDTHGQKGYTEAHG